MKKAKFILMVSLISLFTISIFNYGQVERKNYIITGNDVITTMTDTIGNLMNLETFPFDKMVDKWDGSGLKVFRLFVNAATGSPSNDGLLWSTAKQTITGALSVLPSDLKGYSVYIFIMPGTYNESIIIPFSNTVCNLYQYNTYWTSGTSDQAIWSKAGEAVTGSDTPVIINGGSGSACTVGGGSYELIFNAYNPDNNKQLAKMFKFTTTATPTTLFTAGWGGGDRIVDFIGCTFDLQGTTNFGVEIGQNNLLYFSSCEFIGGTGAASTGSGNWNTAVFINTFGVNTYFGNRFPYNWETGFAPVAANGIYFEDIKQAINLADNSTSKGAVLNFASISYVDIDRAYGKTIIRVASTVTGADIRYHSDYNTLTSTTNLARKVTELKTGTVNNYISTNYYEIGNQAYIKNLPTSAPATSGALWRDAGAGNVIKVVP